MTEFYPEKFFLRFAITPNCNFRCDYCNPEGSMEKGRTLSDDEIMQIMRAGTRAGITRVHYTGGEPTIKNMGRFLAESRSLGYVDQVVTTNGSCGGDYVRMMASSGMNRIIVSLDTLDPIKFQQITKRDCLEDVLDTIRTAVEILDEPTKINVVYMEETRHELPGLIRLGQEINANSRNRGSLIVKLLEITEMNPVFYTEGGRRLYDEHHTGKDVMMMELKKFGTLQPVDVVGNNPNTHYFFMPEVGMTFGMINLPSEGYKCGQDGCTKIRLNPYGMIAVCVNQVPIDIKERSEDEQVDVMRGLIQYRGLIDIFHPHRKRRQENFGYWRFGNCGDQNAGK